MNKTTIISLVAGIVVLCVIVIALAKYQAGQTDNQSQANSSTNTTDPATNEDQNSDQPVQIEDLAMGEGDEVKVGDTITVHYRGTLADGTQFDSSYDRGQPATFQLVQGGLIDGWIEGIPGMKVGGKRKLVIPAAKGYGASGNGSVPPNADLTFEVELVKIGQ